MYAINDFATELEEVHYSTMYVTDLEKKIKILEQKNSELYQYKIQCERLSLELKHVTNLKESYEEKYNEASMKLLYMDDEDSFIFTETEQVKTLNQKCSIFMHANEDLKIEIEDLKAIVERLNDELHLERSRGKVAQVKTCEKSTNTFGIEEILVDKAQIFNVRKSTKVGKREYLIDDPIKSSSIFLTRDVSDKCFSTFSVSPFGRTTSTPFIANSKKLGQNRGTARSPKGSKLKARYVPSFLRKTSSKKLCT